MGSTGLSEADWRNAALTTKASTFTAPEAINYNPDKASATLVQVIASRKTAMTVPELARMLSLSKVSLYELVKRGRLPALKIGGSIRLDPKQTAEWLSSSRLAA